MIGQMAIALALLGFNDLGCSVTPTFLFRKRFYLLLSPHCPKINKMWEVKKISRFLSSGHGIPPSCGCKAHEAMVTFSLNIRRFPHDVTVNHQNYADPTKTKEVTQYLP